MILQLKHLAPYLPYGLMCELKDQGALKQAKLSAVYIDNSYAFFDTVESEHGYDSIKPILKPLSDYLELDSKALIELGCDLSDQWMITELAERRTSLQNLDYSTILIMLEHHIDMFRLIDKGLAIDFNTIDKD